VAKKISDDIIYNIHEYGIYPPTREIFLHRYFHSESGDDGDGCGIDYRSAITFIKNLRLLDLQNQNPILIHMQSRGGDWDDGMAIYDAISATQSYVTVLTYAHARSMTSIIFQAADRRVMMPNCIFLAHQGFLTIDDRVGPALLELEQTKLADQKMLDIYAWRARKGKYFQKEKMDEKQVRKFIWKKIKEKTDWILTAKQTVYYGLADGILGQKNFKNLEDLRR